MLSSDSEAVLKLLETFQNVRLSKKKVCKHQLCNCEELGLNFYRKPSKTFPAKEKNHKFSNIRGERKVLSRCNASYTLKL